MTATELKITGITPRKRRLVWPWAVLSALAAALLLPLAIFLVELPREAEIPVMVACGVAGFVLAYVLAPRPVLRIRLLGVAVLVSAVWAAWAYRTNLHRWPVGINGYSLPWGVSNSPDWAVIALPIAVGLCTVAAIVSLLRLSRGRLIHTGWWTALLAIALVVCSCSALLVLFNRAYLA
jgi:hypothetical protein